ncbi:MAG: hypothetical protein JWO92_10 [Chitinophagaceae bacterium]|nr:hypothetical protein [Chitinophagaceae bacterium]
MKHSHSALKNLIDKANNQLSKAHANIKQGQVIFESDGYAAKNLPRSNEVSIRPYLITIIALYVAIKRDISVILQGGAQTLLGKVNLGTSNQKIDLMKKAIEKVEEKIRHLTVDKCRMNLEGNCKTYLRYRMLLILFALGEILWVVAALLKLGDVVLMALGLGIAIGLAQITAVKTVTQIIKEIKDKKKQKLYTIIAGIAFFLFSLSLGLLRYWFVHTGPGGNIPFIAMNPFTFVAINMLFIVATALIVFFFYPGKEELKKIQMVVKIQEEIKMAQKEKQEQEKALFELMNERQFLMEAGIILNDAEKQLHKKVDSCYEESVGIFKLENTLKRPDGTFPVSFNNLHDPLPGVDSNNLFSIT